MTDCIYSAALHTSDTRISIVSNHAASVNSAYSTFFQTFSNLSNCNQWKNYHLYVIIQIVSTKNRKHHLQKGVQGKLKKLTIFFCMQQNLLQLYLQNKTPTLTSGNELLVLKKYFCISFKTQKYDNPFETNISQICFPPSIFDRIIW
jgi:hypothetical protein